MIDGGVVVEFWGKKKEIISRKPVINDSQVFRTVGITRFILASTCDSVESLEHSVSTLEDFEYHSSILYTHGQEGPHSDLPNLV